MKKIKKVNQLDTEEVRFKADSLIFGEKPNIVIGPIESDDKEFNKIMKFNSFSPVSENLKYHLEKKMPILENIFRPGSEAFFELLVEAKNNKHLLNEDDKYLFETTNLGEFAEFDGKLVPLDLPMNNLNDLNEAKYDGREVKLNKPMRSSGPKKYMVYVRNPKTGNVMKVDFGDVKGGLTAKINDPEARKNFASRHKCELKTDKTKPGYWSCNLPRYAKYLGLSGGGNYFW